MIEFAIKILLSYLLGSLSGSLLLGRAKGVDVRTQGSGNAGATNAFRSGGALFGLAVLVIDVLKGVLAVLLIARLSLPLATVGTYTDWLPYLCGAAVVIGHIYPVFFGFKGGKGAATMIGALLCLVPQAMPWGVAVWLLCLLMTGYVGLATILGAFAIAVAVPMVMQPGWFSPATLFAGFAALLMLYTHRSNIQRLLQGEESRFEKAMLLHRLVRR